jgi:Uncharacterized protein conserved in bacteria (DUF2059)
MRPIADTAPDRGHRGSLRIARLGVLLSLSLGLLLPLPVSADAETDALIDQIIELSGVRAQVLDSLIATSQQGMLARISDSGMPPRAGEILVEEITVLMQEIVADPRLWVGAHRAYAEAFTLDELIGLRDFYRTELGQKLVRDLPQIRDTLTQQMVPVLREYRGSGTVMRRAVPRLLEEGLINELQASQMLASTGG